MKRLLLLLIAVCFGATSILAMTITIGSGTTTTSTLPISSCWGYSYTQQIYTQSQINQSGTITKIRFYYASGAYTNSLSWTIYLGHTTKTTFATTSDWVPASEMTMVYSGNVTYPAAGNWMEITFTTPFSYNNVNNLVIAVDENTPNFNCSVNWRSFTSGTNTGIYYRNDSSNPNPSSPPVAGGRVNILPQVQLEIESGACSGTPAPGNTLASINPACAGANFILSLQNNTPGTGVSYVWQSSPDGNEPWTNFGTSSSTQTVSQTVSTYYRCQVTCSANTGTSNPVQVTMNPWYTCYCTPTYSSGGAADNMPLVVLGALSQTTVGNTSPYYYNYTTTQNAIPNLALGSTVPLYITMGSDSYGQYNGVWIDFDHSGSFSASEFFTSGTNTPPNGIVTVSITIPQTALLGNTRMRIRGGDDTQPLSTQACGASQSSYGQAHDYLVNIAEPSSMSGYVYDYNNIPISGAEVKQIGGASTLTNGSGYYELAPLPSGDFDFRCYKSGYNEVIETITIPDVTEVNHNFTLLKPAMAVTPTEIFAILGANDNLTTVLNIQNDGDGVLNWELSEISNDNCEYTIELRDSYGDGWNGGKVDVLVNNVVVLNDLTIVDGFGPETYAFPVGSGDVITTVYTAGNWSYENLFKIFDATGQQVWSAAGNLPSANILPGQLTGICDLEWLTSDFISGQVNPFGATEGINITLDAAATPPSMAPGVTYTGQLVFASTTEIPDVTVPVTLIVTDGSLQGPEELTPYIMDAGNGQFMLKWKYFTLRDMSFTHFAIARDGVIIGTTPVSSFTFMIDQPGTYCYKVYAVYEGSVYSEPSGEVCISYPLAPGVPVANWALLIGGILMISFVFMRFYRKS